MKRHWVSDANIALFTDYYELTMLEAYWHEQMTTESAVFSLFVRRLPKQRNFLLAVGLESVLDYLESLRFDGPCIDLLRGLGTFREPFLEWLAGLRFTGDIYAVREGTPVFANEPILEVVASLPQGQLIETFLMNQIHHQTVVASKAVRVIEAAQGRLVVDFGLRRMHGADAGLKSARAFHIAGLKATSNVLAGCVYGVPVTGTMAHSYVQSHDDELEAFRAFARVHPNTILLVDTYDTLEGVRKVVKLAEELGGDFQVRGIRLDSGDLVKLAFEARRILDDAGLGNVGIFASGGLDEHQIAGIVAEGAPISGFGVGTGLGVSDDEPSLDLAYKLTEFAGKGRVKMSPDKPVLPGQKQVFRVFRDGKASRDILAGFYEKHDGQPLLEKVMAGGKRLPSAPAGLDELRDHAAREIQKLPESIRGLEPAEMPYPVEISQGLKRRHQETLRKTAR